MTLPLLIAMPGNEALAAELAKDLGYELGALDTRQFPDGETYLRFESDPKGRSVAFVCTLARPNEKFLPLLFAAMTARELGACQVGLICPYLAYMRQDRQFNAGRGRDVDGRWRGFCPRLSIGSLPLTRICIAMAHSRRSTRYRRAPCMRRHCFHNGLARTSPSRFSSAPIARAGSG